ncbi:TIGR01777 family protein [Chryseobacterium indologenes]|uniref:TIGR01777 family oxidoreductase n=2 Tax=Chryseobacterium indologenes TaxID=253 RepID=UPI000F4DAF96|nr:TIGR01777 family oxidoreductase [Chryseobacterium indologenes]AYZ35005.1 TIGR01777 family protein [Chryseobacterium indologenes]MBF6643751.1 TIGR01777 family protein [Chryseobacterium indologenes]MBU3047626.1 TIGR01777 family oxidoreductase [Chryseobacterium indologenes]MEB4761660.1 TIGR01777 family oxidoreductase [Chryseobacterium indologenes]QQQ72517.1 TIGR01777 family oxidoreductase [Chryseobacterium indologenes]
MKIIIAGGTGFLGENLEKYFTEKGNRVYILTRKPRRENEIYWNAKTVGEWQNILENADVLINLTGKSVDCRYNEKNKQEIYSSRIESTKVLQKAIDSCSQKPKIWMNASSATIYVYSEKHLNTEENGMIGDDFSMNICKSWEKEFFTTKNEEVRKVALRTSIVLGNNGGAFPKLKMITKLGLGGKQGRGNQMVSWIHIDDFCRAVEWVISHQDLTGAINVTAPDPISNEAMMRKLRKQVNAPIALNTPVWQLEIASVLMGTETELLLKSRNVFPGKLLESGFQFSYETFDIAVLKLFTS